MSSVSGEREQMMTRSPGAVIHRTPLAPQAPSFQLRTSSIISRRRVASCRLASGLVSLTSHLNEKRDSPFPPIHFGSHQVHRFMVGRRGVVVYSHMSVPLRSKINTQMGDRWSTTSRSRWVVDHTKNSTHFHFSLNTSSNGLLSSATPYDGINHIHGYHRADIGVRRA